MFVVSSILPDDEDFSHLRFEFSPCSRRHTMNHPGDSSTSAHLSFFLFLSLLSALSLLNDDDNDRSSSWLSVHTALTCPECQSAWALAHSLWDEHVRFMQETSVHLFLCKFRATWNEVGLYLCWKEECVWGGVVWWIVVRCRDITWLALRGSWLLLLRLFEFIFRNSASKSHCPNRI